MLPKYTLNGTHRGFHWVADIRRHGHFSIVEVRCAGRRRANSRHTFASVDELIEEVKRLVEDMTAGLRPDNP